MENKPSREDIHKTLEAVRKANEQALKVHKNFDDLCLLAMALIDKADEQSLNRAEELVGTLEFAKPESDTVIKLRTRLRNARRKRDY